MGAVRGPVVLSTATFNNSLERGEFSLPSRSLVTVSIHAPPGVLCDTSVSTLVRGGAACTWLFTASRAMCLPVFFLRGSLQRLFKCAFVSLSSFSQN